MFVRYESKIKFGKKISYILTLFNVKASFTFTISLKDVPKTIFRNIRERQTNKEKERAKMVGLQPIVFSHCNFK